MTTLAKNKHRDNEIGNLNNFPIVASDILYDGAATGLVLASGHSRPLNSADKFVGFAIEKTDNSLGAAAAKNCLVSRQGAAKLPVTGAVITDVGQPVYATDDNAFTFSPVGAVFIGKVKRFVSAGVVIVAYDVDNQVDPWAGYTCELVSDNKTLDVQDSGKAFFVDTDAKVITLPVTATALDCAIVNVGAYGTVAVNVSPAAADKIMGPDLAGADDADLINTKATAQRGDFVAIRSGHADGYIVTRKSGTWASA